MELKQRIIEQASGMFLKRGIKAITMDDIAVSLGISKRTLYEKFTTKEELLTDCMEYLHMENLRVISQIMEESGDDPLEIIHRHFKHALSLFTNIHPGFFDDLQKYHPALCLKEIESQMHKTEEFTSSLIEKGIQRGIFRDDLNPIILSRATNTFYRFISYHDTFPDPPFSHTEVFRQVTLCIIRGMATPAGLKMIDEKFKQ